MANPLKYFQIQRSLQITVSETLLHIGENYSYFTRQFYSFNSLLAKCLLKFNGNYNIYMFFYKTPLSNLLMFEIKIFTT